MNRKNLLTIVVILMIAAGCQQKRTDKTDNGESPKSQSSDSLSTSREEEKPDKEMIFFKAQGNEPFWNISLSEKEMLFTSLIEGYEELHTPLPKLQRAADANVKRYQAETEKVNLTLTISQGSCADTMADKEYGYKVTVEIQLSGEATPKNLTGCGDYVTDMRLHDIWVLEQLGEQPVQEGWFAKESPRFELHSTENNFSGYAGCNQMRGNIFWEPGLLRFTEVITTRKACIPENREGEFLKALQKTTTYKIENNRLFLSNPDENLLIFKKTD